MSQISYSVAPVNRRFCIAPMMDWSDRHCRYFWRLLTKQAVLYTEMVTTGALLHGDHQRFLKFNPEESPVALQLGGSDPRALAQCAKMAEDWGYSEVNFNCGCPSDRVQSGKIGAVLMAEPALVANCMAAMKDACSIPVTIKHRIGIDDMEDYDGMRRFVGAVAEAGCGTFIIHARKAWLKGLSPKENREIPPLNYDLIFQLKEECPELEIIINGGIKTVEQCRFLLALVDGVMVGREAYQNPYFLSEIDREIFSAQQLPPTREEVIEGFIQYMERESAKGTRLHHMTRHILGLYSGRPGARAFRRHITEWINRPGSTTEIVRQALNYT